VKAWYVFFKNNPFEYSKIVFANTSSAARVLSLLHSEVDYIDLRAHRVPELDDKPKFNDRDLYNAGYLPSCRKCYHVIYDPYFDNDDNAYCLECFVPF